MRQKFTCLAVVNYNGTQIAMIKPEPLGDPREHITVELLKDRIEFERGAVYEVEIRKVDAKSETV